MKSTCRLWLIFSLSLSSLWSAEEIYYDLDFSGEPYTPYEAIQTDESNRTPSSVPFGQLEVIDDLDGQLDRALFFNTKDNKPHFYYDQIRFEVGKQQETYHLGFDLVVKNLKGSPNRFRVLLDLPKVSNFDLDSDGYIVPTSPTRLKSPFPKVPFQEGVPMRVDISVDLPSQRRVVLLNGKLIYDGPIFLYHDSKLGIPVTATDLRSVRFSLGLARSRSEPDHATQVAVDNIVIDNQFVLPKK